MGWSVPQVPSPQKPAAWSPWVVVFIFVLGYALALGWVVMDTPASGLYPLASGHYLPLTGFTLAGILFVLSLYHLVWEIDALRYFNTRHWQTNTHAAWQRWAHQSLYVVKSIHCTTDAELIPRAAGLSSSTEERDAPGVLLFPDEPAPPGMYRFEALCRHLLTALQAEVYSLKLPKQATVNLYIQTQTAVTDAHTLYLDDLWQVLFPDLIVRVNPIAANISLGSWSECLDARTVAVVLAMHYYDGIDENPIGEMATALLLAPGSALKNGDKCTMPRLFRAMPVKTQHIADDLKDLRDMTQQPVESIRLFWFSGLGESLRQKLSAAVYDLALPLRKDAPMGGVLDFDKDNAQYGALSGWLLAGAATQMVELGQGTQWILCNDNNQTWAMVVGNQAPVLQTPAEDLPDEPYPAGSVTLALLFNIVLFWALGHAWPQWLFSGWGLATVIVSMLVTFPGFVLALRGLVNRLQKPYFIKAANASVRD